MSNRRRNIVFGSLAAVAASLVGKYVPSIGPGDVSFIGLDLRKLVDAPASAGILGSAYLKSFPQENDFRILSSLILDVLAPASHGAANGDLRLAELRLRTASTIAREFGDEDWVEVDGWLLSRTEARLFALCATA